MDTPRPPPGAIGGDFTGGGMGRGFERGMFLPEDGGFLTLSITSSPSSPGHPWPDPSGASEE